MASDLSSYKVANLEVGSSSKFDNLVQAVQDALNAIGDTTKMAFAAGKIIDPTQIKQNGALSGQALVWNGTDWAPATVGGGGGGDTRYSHTTKTTDTTISATSEGSATGIITTPSVAYTVDPVLVTFFTPRIDVTFGATGNITLFFVLKRDSTVIAGKWASLSYGFNTGPPADPDEQAGPVCLVYQDTPTAASHTYSVLAYYTLNSGAAPTTLVKAGSGGSGGLAPACLRTFKDA